VLLLFLRRGLYFFASHCVALQLRQIVASSSKQRRGGSRTDPSNVMVDEGRPGRPKVCLCYVVEKHLANPLFPFLFFLFFFFFHIFYLSTVARDPRRTFPTGAGEYEAVRSRRRDRPLEQNVSKTGFIPVSC
jgi:hypothetical protein